MDTLEQKPGQATPKKILVTTAGNGCLYQR